MFMLKFADGSERTEEEGPWDSVPDEPIVEMRLRQRVLTLVLANGTRASIPHETVLPRGDAYFYEVEGISAVSISGGSAVDIPRNAMRGGSVDYRLKVVTVVTVGVDGMAAVEVGPITGVGVSKKALRRGSRC